MTTSQNAELTALWHDDKLNRQSEAEFLSNYLINKFTVATEQNGQSFVLNINADWGFGKTYFLQNWAKTLQAKNHHVVYFNAWENDFSDNPLLAFISEINDSLDEFMAKDDSTLTKAKKGFMDKMGVLKHSAAPLLMGILAKQLTGFSQEAIKELFEDDPVTSCPDKNSSAGDDSTKPAKSDVGKTVSSIVTKTAELALKEHKTTKDAIVTFKTNLADLVVSIKDQGDRHLPLFILVDELDRCRPNYAIELLETIKHLFEVKGVYFVVATASDQLSHSIKAIYGAGFESKRYLTRFFDQEYQLVAPNIHDYCQFLWARDISNEERLLALIPDDRYKGQNMNVVVIEVIAQYTKASFRDIEKAVKLIQAINLTSEGPLYTVVLVFLIFCKIRHPDDYPKICRSWDEFHMMEETECVSISDFMPSAFFLVVVESWPSGKLKMGSIGVWEALRKITKLQGINISQLIRFSQDEEYQIKKEQVSGDDFQRFFVSKLIATLDDDAIYNDLVLDFSRYHKLVDQVGQLM